MRMLHALAATSVVLAGSSLALSNSVANPGASEISEDDWGPLEIIGRQIPPGVKQKFSFVPQQTFEGAFLDAPVFAARGALPGPTLCLTAGVHGDELNGIEIARQAFADVDPVALSGTLIVLPAINADGFRTGSRYLPDRRDLNRYFPGKPDGSVASIIADAVFSNVIVRCQALIDLHTGSNQRANQPQIRADLSDEPASELARHFGVGIILHGRGPSGSLRREAMDAGIPAIIYEAGEPMRFQRPEIDRGVEGVNNVMAYLEMIERRGQETPPSRVFRRSRWVRVSSGQGGFFFPDEVLGAAVTEGDVLGQVIDPLSDERFPIVAPFAGEVIGMAVPQVVLSGYALFHIGLRE